MIGIALLRTLKPPNFVLPLPCEIAPLFESMLKIDMPARAPTDNLLLPLRPMISEMGSYNTNINILGNCWI